MTLIVPFTLPGQFLFTTYQTHKTCRYSHAFNLLLLFSKSLTRLMILCESFYSFICFFFPFCLTSNNLVYMNFSFLFLYGYLVKYYTMKFINILNILLLAFWYLDLLLY
ncbi:hypothetical protein HanRHA438_Chr04g0195171 [Helianthus annuus]|nr:hypothetical protein HanRHA438_Chr04g0195171 [Helianthus annuus]